MVFCGFRQPSDASSSLYMFLTLSPFIFCLSVTPCMYAMLKLGEYFILSLCFVHSLQLIFVRINSNLLRHLDLPRGHSPRLVLVLPRRLLHASKILEAKTMELGLCNRLYNTLVLYTLHLHQALPSDSAFLLFSPWEGDHQPCSAYVVCRWCSLYDLHQRDGGEMLQVWYSYYSFG